MHRLNDIPSYLPQVASLQFPPLSACPVYHAIVIPSHVLNIITIMITLKTMSLYLNVVSPHRATILIKIPSPMRRDFFFFCPGQEQSKGLIPPTHHTLVIFAINAQMASLPSVTIRRSKESSPLPETASGAARRTVVIPGSPLAGVTVNPGMAPGSRYHS